MATIKLQRTSEFLNRRRDYNIFIDGQQIGTIANGETKDITTSVGPHTITAKIDWCSSPDLLIDVHENQATTLKVSGFKYGQWLMPVGIGLIVLHLILSMFADIKYIIYLVVPVFLVLAYYLTIGRKNYLSISVLNDN